MRILQLRFKNLNSLAGEWLIDFTHPAFTADGLFAITGPTGAGKTTILDAICLALYGRTPRLNRVTKGMNEIMSRQCGECFAEVTFETQSGQYCCHWSQHRARKKPDGDLQAPKHEISDAKTQTLLESKLKLVAEQIEKLTGMDYDRFTRSMLLAQGGFAAFLQAAPDERAPILEQITGTGIYSQISVRVHEYRTEQRKKLEQLQSGLAGMQMLSPEKEMQLKEALDEKTAQDALCGKQRQQKQQAMQWLEGQTLLRQELNQLEADQKQLETERKAFLPQQQQLDTALRAIELSAPYAELKAKRLSLQENHAQLAACHTELPGCTTAMQQAGKAFTAAEEHYNAVKSEQHTQLSLLRSVRELDVQIAAKTTPAEELRRSVKEQSKVIAEQQQNQQRNAALLRQKISESEALSIQLESMKADEKLTTELTGLRSRFQQMQELTGQIHAKQQAVKQATSTLADDQHQWRQACEQQEIAGKKRQQDEQLVAQQQVALNHCLGEQTLSEWRHHHTALIQMQNRTESALNAAESLSLTQKKRDDQLQRDAVLMQDISVAEATLSEYQAHQLQLEKEAGYLETQLTLIRRIEDLEQARQQLCDGEPCPLCGSETHPYAQGNIPVADDTQQQLEQLRQRLATQRQAVSDLRVHLAGFNKEREQIASRQTEYTAVIQETREQLAGYYRESGIEPAEEEHCLQQLEQHLQSVQQQQMSVLRRVNQAEEAEQTLMNLRQALETTKHEALNHAQTVQTLLLKQSTSAETLERLQRETAKLQEQQQQVLQLLQTELDVYGVAQVTPENLSIIDAELTQRSQRWQEQHAQYSALRQEIAGLELQVQHQKAQLKHDESGLSGQQNKLAEMERVLAALRQQRNELFGDKDADQEELRLHQMAETAEKRLEEQRQLSALAGQTLNQLQEKISDLKRTQDTQQTELAHMEQDLIVQLAHWQFEDEVQYLDACLSGDARQRLMQQSQALAEQYTRLNTLLYEKRQLLETEEKKQLTSESPEMLKKAEALLASQQQQFQQEIGGIRQQLLDNDKLRQQQQTQITAIEGQQRECQRWDTLHELIGSADGKKFRNFAQGLTFEMMIGHANLQLQKMTDRYLLIHDPLNPLELSVIDNYQAGEVRSAKNLSGGESFIVSLALALGLSGMASHNVRVDSLFLDEGFGTLDEDALDTALETLAGLQQEGKLIGVISHIAALKDRISTRIMVSPGNGGKSTISGAGCRSQS
ncbi:Nuclease SbcCD subunit C [Vibrio aerogenes CECT 7868]|uniref:Nuclease SbcCD subunit C n=1 Tax=Vibrio aerogenes CECT 7868 TaxID=1216006 RepID=A0A1M5XEU5_9VIBR|nr:AAA family ATPase [Vibrio aerogenes]SHH97723.1 Nuclease SbcCD subunit C [Vibrio aerogenes CECT 7868]